MSADMERDGKLKDFIAELAGFAGTAESALKAIETDPHGNKGKCEQFSEMMIAIRGTSVQLGLGEIAEMAGLGEEISVKVPSVTKGALINMTEYMALDLLPHAIRVNAIAPGYFPSEMTNPFFESEAGKQEIAALPPKRLGRLEELDGALLLLASEASSYMSGTTLTVDCGHSIRLS